MVRGGRTTLELPVVERRPQAARTFIVVYADERSRVVEIREGQEVTIGRSSQATVTIRDQSVSRLHAAIVRRQGSLYVRDLGSRNGTRCNGVVVNGEIRLAPGDELTVGGASIVVGMTSRIQPAESSGLGTFMERLQAEADRVRRYRRHAAVLMVRIEGEEAAIQAARQRIVQGLRRMDCMADYNPNEIAVLLPETERDGAMLAAYRLRRHAEHAGARATAGVAVMPEEASDAEEAVERARDALLEARSGRGEGGVASAPPRPLRSRDSIIVLDPAMKRVYELVRRVARTDVTVLIQGETGAGKEVVAEEIHRSSPRADGPFVRLNCAALPETLLESELFGAERGAYTGATERRSGYFEAASGGTLLLDEVGELPEGTQVKLLRVLETRRIVRLGGTEEIPVDVRLIAVTNRDLETQVARGRFREDLFFRLSVFTLHVPPLRDRRAEIVPFARLFVSEVAARLGVKPPEIMPEAVSALLAYGWPGNVRELRNVMERAVVLADEAIGLAELPEAIRGRGFAMGPETEGDAIRSRVAAVERRTIEEALAACGGNQTRAAQKLGLSRRALIYKMEKYGLKPPPEKK